MKHSPELEAAYRHCWNIACSHYENFPIGSWLLPREKRRALAAIYAFARIADDLADEGTRTPTERLAALDAWEAELEACFAGNPRSPVYVALADTVRQFQLPIEPFRALLRAFRYDAEFRPFATFKDLLDYCRYSANPVGHLVLYLFGYRDAERQTLADQICTGLQLANFWQDLAIDAAKGRIYIPLEDLSRFELAPDQVLQGKADHERLRALVAWEVERTREFFQRGLVLADKVEARLAREVRLFAHGGLVILDRIAACRYDVWHERPQLSRWDKTRLLLHLAWPSAATPSRGGTEVEANRLGDYEYCMALTRRSSSNFYYAFHLLPREKRMALCALYAFCRFVDDIADRAAPSWSPQVAITRWREEVHAVFHGHPRHPISRALADVAQRYPLSEKHFQQLIDGVESDLERREYQRWEDLREYCYRVASTVGLLCIEIFGYRNPSAKQYAVDLGIAFQLTNILRDVREDAERGRVYLPQADLNQFECTPNDLLQARYSPRVAALLAFECGRARAFYLRARAHLAAEDRRSLAAAEAMRMIYERLLARIEAQNFNVFGPRVTLPRYEKVSLALAAWGRSHIARAW